MVTNTFPQANRTLVIEPSEYTCPVTDDVWKRAGSTITCSDNLIHTGKSYNDSLPHVPQGYRMADNEIIAYLAQRTEELKTEGKGLSKGIAEGRKAAAEEIMQDMAAVLRKYEIK